MKYVKSITTLIAKTINMTDSVFVIPLDMVNIIEMLSITICTSLSNTNAMDYRSFLFYKS